MVESLGSQASQDRGGRLFDRLGGRRLLTIFLDLVERAPAVSDAALATQRAPGVYDMAWHGLESNPQLYCDSAKSIIHCGEGEAEPNWDAGFPLEITFEKAPYALSSGENFSGTITYEGEPVSANFSASYWTWDAHSCPDVQKGTSSEDGSLNNGGLWMICAEYDVQEPGEWTADHDLGTFYKAGDVLPYNSVHCRSTLSVWAK
jgi:hypothetical protein